MEQQAQIPRSLKIAFIAVGLLIVAALVYVYFIRVQDSDYTAASKKIDTMIAKATEFEGLGDENLAPIVATGVQLANAKQIADAYNAALAELEKSPALTRDGEVAKVYESVKKTVKDYGTSTADMVTTVTALSAIKQKCGRLLAQMDSITSLDALKTAKADCSASVEQYTSVPLADFNENYFRPYHDNMTDFLAALETYYTAAEGNAETQKQSAQDTINAKLRANAILNAGNHPIQNTANPTDALRTLQTKLAERSKVFLR